MSAVLFRQCLGNAAGRSATFSKTEMQDSPFLSAKLGNSLLQKTAIEELRKEDPEYQKVEIEMINEDEHPEIIENYDYWSVPSLFIDHDKIFEAALFMPYETVKEGVKLAFDKALEE